jgi:two-component system, LytTR family, response regulator
MLTCIAIDDEQLALELLEDNISKVPFLQLVNTFGNALQAMKFLQEQPVDLIFLDIQMPGMTGLQFIKGLVNKPMIILITAYENYALEGFELDVIDYLLKPVSLERFIKACNKAWEYYQLKLKPSGTNEQADYIFVNADYSLVKINLPDIIWIEGLKDYVKIHLASSARPVIALMTMKAVEEKLPAKRFIRIHKSYIISISHITAVRKNSLFMGQIELPIGGSYREAVDMLTDQTNH